MNGPASDHACKSCGDEYRVTEEQIARVLAAPMFSSPERCVPDAVYEERLRLCLACPRLQGGHTCGVCGCIVRVAAKLKARSCPDPASVRWRRYG